VNGARGADECPADYTPVLDAAVCQDAVHELGVPDTTIDFLADIAGAPRGCLLFGTSPVFAAADSERAGWCHGCTVVCEHVFRQECAASLCDRVLYAQSNRAGGNWGADECPAGYRIIRDKAICAAAARNLTQGDLTLDITADVDGAPQGCLLFGTSPVFAVGDIVGADWCIGCAPPPPGKIIFFCGREVRKTPNTS
jgi:hypothetical protein